MSDLLEDLLAFFYATPDEPVSCARCGRDLSQGENYGLNENGEPLCVDCSDQEDEE
ncbi:hypothetical protein [Geomonas azotofigens]|uniref:hypothetical protein n=1 Tax=Geomonas azotofigens TaxID=2843196 RepID=UPI001C0F66BE|nr:hypothetical protein [Geomonas azotofigens]MBU5615408.1 hypothetical protein [Geomonas azotofigens]